MTTTERLAALAKRMAVAADAALVAQGKAAKSRQRKRGLKAALKVAGKTAVVAGTAAATVMATRAAMRAVRGRKAGTT